MASAQETDDPENHSGNSESDNDQKPCQASAQSREVQNAQFQALFVLYNMRQPWTITNSFIQQTRPVRVRLE